ncbi:hypothetical protein GYB22_10085 [bacterium]|nr:hypothetical protein [bacterium]
MKTLFTFIFVACGTLASLAQTLDISVINGRYVNADGSDFTGIYTEYVDGLKISQVSISNGMLDGQALYYHSNGVVKQTGYFKAGEREGIWKEYNTNGVLTAMSHFEQGKKDGKWEIWDDQGNKRFEMYYANGQKVGTWKMWDADGKLTTKDFGQQ